MAFLFLSRQAFALIQGCETCDSQLRVGALTGSPPHREMQCGRYVVRRLVATSIVWYVGIDADQNHK